MQKFYLLRAVLCVLGIAYLVSTRLLRAERRKAEKSWPLSLAACRGDLVAGGCLAVLSMVFSTGFGGLLSL